MLTRRNKRTEMDNNVLSVAELGELFARIEIHASVQEIDSGMADERRSNPENLGNEEIEAMLQLGVKRCALILSDSATERHNKSLHREIAETAMERAYMLWELDRKNVFVSLYLHELDSLTLERKTARKSDDIFAAAGARFFKACVEDQAEFNGIAIELSEPSLKAIVDEAIEDAVFSAKNDSVSGDRDEIERRMKSLLADKAEKLAEGYVQKSALPEDASENSFYNRFERMTEENREVRESALSIEDPTDLDEIAYEQLIGYAMGVVMSSYSGLSRQECYEIGLASLSRAVITFDPQKAKQSGARFGTHLTWQIKAELKKHTRMVGKAAKYEMDIPRDPEGEERTELLGIDTGAIMDSGGKDEDMTGINIDAARLEKMKIGLRQIRHEMPRITNHLIDLRFGEIMKDDGSPYTNTEYAEIIGLSTRRIGEIQSKGLKLIRAKLKRLGFVDIIEDEQMGADEMRNTDVFLKAHRAMSDSVALSASIPPESV